MTEQELKKACEWLDKRLEFYAVDAGCFNYERFFKDFCKAMEKISGNKREIPSNSCNSDKNLQGFDADYLQSKIDLHTKYMREHGITSEQQLATLEEMRGGMEQVDFVKDEAEHNTYPSGDWRRAIFKEGFYSAAGLYISVVQDWGHYTKVTIMHCSGVGVVELFVYDDTDTAEIASLYVVSQMRGRGIAKMLIQQAEQKAKSLGAKRTKILSEPHLTTFYKELGYKED